MSDNFLFPNAATCAHTLRVLRRNIADAEVRMQRHELMREFRERLRHCTPSMIGEIHDDLSAALKQVPNAPKDESFEQALARTRHWYSDDPGDSHNCLMYVRSYQQLHAIMLLMTEAEMMKHLAPNTDPAGFSMCLPEATMWGDASHQSGALRTRLISCIGQPVAVVAGSIGPATVTGVLTFHAPTQCFRVCRYRADTPGAVVESMLSGEYVASFRWDDVELEFLLRGMLPVIVTKAGIEKHQINYADRMPVPAGVQANELCPVTLSTMVTKIGAPARREFTFGVMWKADGQYEGGYWFKPSHQHQSDHAWLIRPSDLLFSAWLELGPQKEFLLYATRNITPVECPAATLHFQPDHNREDEAVLSFACRSLPLKLVMVHLDDAYIVGTAECDYDDDSEGNQTWFMTVTGIRTPTAGDDRTPKAAEASIPFSAINGAIYHFGPDILHVYEKVPLPTSRTIEEFLVYQSSDYTADVLPTSAEPVAGDPPPEAARPGGGCRIE